MNWLLTLAISIYNKDDIDTDSVVKAFRNKIEETFSKYSPLKKILKL